MLHSDESWLDGVAERSGATLPLLLQQQQQLQQQVPQQQPHDESYNRGR